MNNKPIVFNPNATPPIQRLQPNDDLDIPLEQRFQELRGKYAQLIFWLLDQRFTVPADQINYMTQYL